MISGAQHLGRKRKVLVQLYRRVFLLSCSLSALLAAGIGGIYCRWPPARCTKPRDMLGSSRSWRGSSRACQDRWDQTGTGRQYPDQECDMLQIILGHACGNTQQWVIGSISGPMPWL
jgi:hypothetical protein